MLAFAEEAESNQNASGVCLGLLERGAYDPSAVTLVVADVGPGSFIGVRVGVTIAKTMAYALGVPVAGVSAFDLINPSGVAVIPSKRGEFFVREPGREPVRTTELPTRNFKGYGSGVQEIDYPEARLAASLLPTLKRLRAEDLLPEYLVEPSISTPKRAYRQETV